MKAKDLQPGQRFLTKTELKLPSELIAKQVIVHKRRVTVIPQEPFSDYKFSFFHDEQV